ncbi:C2 domain, partial [Trinorchestia longiramus]
MRFPRREYTEEDCCSANLEDSILGQHMWDFQIPLTAGERGGRTEDGGWKRKEAKELPAKDLSGTSDPYVRVMLLPDKKHKLETKIKRRTLHPKWHETFYFEEFPIQKLNSRVLHLHVFDYDRFSRDDSIGEVHIPLCQVDFSEKNNTFWKALRPLEKNKCGEILTSLCYQPSNSQLTLTIIKCRNLKAKDINGKSDPYVKIWLYFGEKRIEKKRSEVQFCTLNPEFNFTVMFE